MFRQFLAAAAALLATVTIVSCGSGSDANTLRVGTEGTYSPFSFQGPDGKLTGYDVEVAQAVGAKLGKQVEFVQTPWDAIFAGLEAKRFDLVANQVTVNDERKAKYDLSEPYTVSEGVIVTRADDTTIASLADLRGKTTAQSATSNWAQVARDAGATVEAVEGFVQAGAAAQGRQGGRHRQRHPGRRRVPEGPQRQCREDRRDHRGHQRAGVRRPQGQRPDRRRQPGPGRAARRRHAEADLGQVLRLRRQRRVNPWPRDGLTDAIGARPRSRLDDRSRRAVAEAHRELRPGVRRLDEGPVLVALQPDGVRLAGGQPGRSPGLAAALPLDDQDVVVDDLNRAPVGPGAHVRVDGLAGVGVVRDAGVVAGPLVVGVGGPRGPGDRAATPVVRSCR